MKLVKYKNGALKKFIKPARYFSVFWEVVIIIALTIVAVFVIINKFQNAKSRK